jgi:hypothetical protein
MPSGALHAARGVQLREESNQHALSLPSTAPDGKRSPDCDSPSELLPARCGARLAIFFAPRS